MHKRLLSLLLLLCGTALLTATDYYVAKDGADTNDGSEAAPFLTISKAASLMVAGDVCYIKEGVYREVINPANGGTASAPITFTAFGEDEVTVSATEVIEGWAENSGPGWKASATLTRGRHNAIYFNGEPMDLARWPNNEDQDPFTIDAMTVTGGAADRVTATELPPGVDLTDAYIWYLGAHSGTSWTREISSVSGNSIIHEANDINRWPFNPHNPTVFRNGNRGRFYVMGALGLLDYAREWHYENGEVYLVTPNDANPNGGVVEYAVRAHTVLIEKPYVTIEGITTFGGMLELKGDHAVIRDNNILRGFQSIDETNNTDAQVSAGSVWVRASNIMIDGNEIEGGSMNGISVQGWGGVSDITIQNNVIREFNTVGNHSSPVRCRAPRSKMIANTIIGAGRDGVFIPASDCEIAYNDVSDCMRINNDGGMFYVVGNDNDKNTSIHHNWFHDSFGPDYADGRCAGIYLDNDSKGYDVHHNVVWDVSWSAVQMNWDAWNNDIFNNTFWNAGQAMGIWLNGRVQKDNRIWNNYSSNADWEGQDIADNIINPTDQFEDVDAGNFMPRANSPLINAGREIAGITDDFSGDAPDVGAYERGRFRWVPGAPSEGGAITGVPLLTASSVRAQISPNPTGDVAFLTYDMKTRGNLDWRLVSAQGRIVRQGREANLLSGEQRIDIDVRTLPAGAYALIGRVPEGQFARRLVVAR